MSSNPRSKLLNTPLSRRNALAAGAGALGAAALGSFSVIRAPAPPPRPRPWRREGRPARRCPRGGAVDDRRGLSLSSDERTRSWRRIGRYS